MPISIKANASLLAVALALFFTPQTGMCAKPELKKVTRIEKASVVKRGDKLVIHVEGMAATNSLIPKGGKLVRHDEAHGLNKEGLLEYDLYFNPPRNPKEKFNDVRASLKDSAVPGVKGVRIFAEFNKMDALLAEPKKKKSKEKEKLL